MCDAISRKTNKRCPHKSWAARVPNVLASHNVCDGNQHCVEGVPVELCRGHARSWDSRRRRGLTLKLINGGYLSAYNKHKYGSIVLSTDHPDLDVVLKVPKVWSKVTRTSGNVPPHVAEQFGIEV
jgi:hypothetical protein